VQSLFPGGFEKTAHYLHTAFGLLIASDHYLELELMAMESNVSERELAHDVVGVIWPSTTAVSLCDMDGLNSKDSDFNKKRMLIAASM
jgi:hypothetical protein